MKNGTLGVIVASALLSTAVAGILVERGASAQYVPPPGVRTATAPLVVSGQNMSIHVADASHDGYLSSADWIRFNAGGGGGGGGGGGVVAVVQTSLVHGFSCSTVMPWGFGSSPTSAPLITDGCLINTISYAATSTSDWIQLTGSVNFGGAGGNQGVCAVWAGSTDLGVTFSSPVSNFNDQGEVSAFYRPGTTSAVTYELRCGPGDVNGSPTAVGIMQRPFNSNDLYSNFSTSGLELVEFGSGSGGGGGGGLTGVNAPLTASGGIVSIPAATNSVDGYMTSTDHTKLSAVLAPSCENSISLPVGVSIPALTATTFSNFTCTGAASGDSCSISFPGGSSVQTASIITQLFPTSGHVNMNAWCVKASGSCTFPSGVSGRALCYH